MNSTQSNLKSVFNSDGTRKMATVASFVLWRSDHDETPHQLAWCGVYC